MVSQRSVEVERSIPIEVDAGLLAAYDINPIDTLEPKQLKNYARDATQVLLNKIFSLPTRTEEMGIFAELPEPTTQLPRAKPIPKEKPMTRWEKFAKSKGIQKKKQDRYMYDETLGEERPRFGRHSAKNDPMQDWCVELPDNDDGAMINPRKAAKKERINKNLAQQRRNAEGGNRSELALKRDQVKHQLAISKKSTASLGKFDEGLEKDIKTKLNTKRHFDDNMSMNEGQKALKIAEKVANPSGKLNIKKALKHMKIQKKK